MGLTNAEVFGLILGLVVLIATAQLLRIPLLFEVERDFSSNMKDIRINNTNIVPAFFWLFFSVVSGSIVGFSAKVVFEYLAH